MIAKSLKLKTPRHIHSTFRSYYDWWWGRRILVCSLIFLCLLQLHREHECSLCLDLLVSLLRHLSQSSLIDSPYLPQFTMGIMAAGDGLILHKFFWLVPLFQFHLLLEIVNNYVDIFYWYNVLNFLRNYLFLNNVNQFRQILLPKRIPVSCFFHS